MGQAQVTRSLHPPAPPWHPPQFHIHNLGRVRRCLWDAPPPTRSVRAWGGMASAAVIQRSLPRTSAPPHTSERGSGSLQNAGSGAKQAEEGQARADPAPEPLAPGARAEGLPPSPVSPLQGQGVPGRHCNPLGGGRPTAPLCGEQRQQLPSQDARPPQSPGGTHRQRASHPSSSAHSRTWLGEGGSGAGAGLASSGQPSARSR